MSAWIEAAVVAVASVTSLVTSLRQGAVPAGGNPAADVFLGCAALGLTVLLAVGGARLWVGRRTLRGPVLTWQVFQVILSVGVLGRDDLQWLGVAGILLAVSTAVGLVLPGPRHPDPSPDAEAGPGRAPSEDADRAGT